MAETARRFGQGDLTARVEEYEDELDEKDGEIAALKRQLAAAEKEGQSQTRETDSGELDALREELASARNQADELKAENSELQQSLQSLSDKSELFDQLCNELSDGNVGYGSPEFFAAESVIVLNREETGRSFHIYGVMDTTYTFHETGTSADCTWRGEWSGDWALIDIVPTGTGITVVDFNNNMNSDTFKVIIVVTE